MCSSLAKHCIFPVTSLPQLSKVLLKGLSTHVVFSLHFGMPIGSCLSSIRFYSHVGESYPCLYFMTLLETNLTTNSMII